jgi:hypothetical protein
MHSIFNDQTQTSKATAKIRIPLQVKLPAAAAAGRIFDLQVAEVDFHNLPQLFYNTCYTAPGPEPGILNILENPGEVQIDT